MNFPLELLIQFTRLNVSEVIMSSLYLVNYQECCRLDIYQNPTRGGGGGYGEVANQITTSQINISSNFKNTFCHGRWR